MRVSLNTIKQYTDVDLPVGELVARINQQLGGVEEVIDLGERYKDAVIAKVVKCDKHPNADKLSVCEIDAGTGEYIQVVCGAPNVREGLFVVWLPPKSVVPVTFDDAEPFVLEPKELRGVVSHGMLASAKELGISDDHDGIVELTEKDLSPSANYQSLTPGQSFAEVFGLNDIIIDIENKMFTHRPDLFGQLGVAREIAGIQQKRFTDPDWYWSQPELQPASGLDLEVINDTPENVPRFTAVAMKNVEVKPSPLWLQCALVAMGSKPINNVVDVTNYVMLLTAQPTHAYDYDKLRGHKLGVRMAKKGEQAALLNGKTYELDESDIVIVDSEGIVGLGGIMGGGNSEVSSETKNIVLEVANFDMYAVRKSSMRHGLFTDALTRFNKGQSPLQNNRVVNLLMQSMTDVSGAVQASDVADLTSESITKALKEQSNSGTLKVEASFINERLGLSLKEPDIQQLLRNVGFACYVDEGDTATSITAPFWRTDIELAEDVVEEVGRLYGFDKLPRELPVRSMKGSPKNPKLELKRLIRESLSRAGANEVLTYSFVHEKTLRNAQQNPGDAFKLSNALSPDLQYYRLSVLPSLLEKVHPNIKSGHDEFALFEIGKGHDKQRHADDGTGLPRELEFVDAVYAGKLPSEGAAYYQVRRLVSQLAGDLGFELTFKPIEKPIDFPVTAPFDQARSAIVEDDQGNFIGIIGELKQSVLRKFKLPAYTAALSLDLEGLQKAHEAPRQPYAPLSKYPPILQDMSLKVDSDMPYEDLFKSVQDALDDVLDEHSDAKLSPLAIYQSDDDTAHKTITLRLKLTSHTGTLSTDQANELVNDIAKALHVKTGAVLV